MGTMKYLGIPQNAQGKISLKALVAYHLRAYKKIQEAINILYVCKEIVTTKTAKSDYANDIKILKTKSYQLHEGMRELERRLKKL